MRAFWRRRSLFTTRRVIRALEGLESQLAEQNKLLARLADHFVPVFPATEPARSSVDYLNPHETGLVLDYVERTRLDLGRDPTEEEILRYLADDATEALHREKHL